MPDENTTPTQNTEQSAVSDEQLAAMAEKSGDSVEHMREMLNVADGTPTDNGNDQQNGELLAGKYSNEEELSKGFNSLVEKFGMEKAYKLLEKGMGGGQDEDANTTPDADDQGEPGSEDAGGNDPGEGGGDGADAGDDDSPLDAIDWNALSNEYAQTGDLSEDALQQLTKAGLPQNLIEEFVSGAEARAQLWNGQVIEMAGGEQEYQNLVTWAADNLSDTEVGAFNEALAGMDPTKFTPLMDSLKAKYTAANGPVRRKIIEPGSGDSGVRGVKGYESSDQMMADMKDPKYKAGDEAFHKMVRAKIKASKIL